MSFGEVLSRAWQILSKYKVLWIFGILAGFGSATGTSGSNTSYRFQQNIQVPGTAPLDNFFQRMPNWEIGLIVVIILIVVLLLWLLSVVLGTIGRIGLIHGTQLADQNTERLSFGQLWSASLPYFWRLLGLNILIGIGILVLGFLAVLIYLGGSIATLGLGFICLLPIFCLLVPAIWFIQLVQELANIALVVENTGIMDGIRRGWEMVVRNFGPVLIMGLILVIGVGWIGGFIISLPFAVVVAPALAGAMIGTQTAAAGGFVLTGLCLVVYIPVMIFLFGLLRTYITSAWTLTYMRLNQTSAPSIQSITPPFA